MEDYRELIVWRQSMELVRQVYALTKLLPKEETFALSNQIRRAVVSSSVLILCSDVFLTQLLS